MEERYIEIKFYYYLVNLVNTFKSSVHIIDYIESICLLANINPTIIKAQLRDIRLMQSRIASYTEETIYVCLNQGMSFRSVAKMTGSSLSTIYRVNKSMDPSNYIGLTRRLPLKEYKEVEKFMDFIRKFKEVE